MGDTPTAVVRSQLNKRLHLQLVLSELCLQMGGMKWLGLFGQVNRFYKWMTAGFMPQPGLVGAG
jgi:hypothetical protein